MMKLNIQNETSKLKAVILGTAQSNGATPKVEDCYDPKSIEHVLAGTYALEEDMIAEMEAVAAVFKKYNVTVFRPEIIKNYNQIFSRDIGFVIDDVFVRANILPDRDKEIHAIDNILEQINPNKIISLPEEAHVEGGDIMPWNEYIFVGTYSGEEYPNYITARTNTDAVIALLNIKIKEQFSIAYSFDYTLSKIQLGAHNTCLLYTSPSPRDRG